MKTAGQLKLILIALMTKARAHKLTQMAWWRLRNPDAKKKWDTANSAHVRLYEKAFAKANAERKSNNMRLWRLKNIQSVRIRKLKWDRDNPSKVKAIQKGVRTRRYARYPHVRLIKGLQVLLGLVMKNKGGRRTTDIIGCDAPFFLRWIESQFLPGMSMEKRSEWHIDHIFPTSCCGDDEAQILLAQHYRNLRPMWRKANCEKTSKLTPEGVVSAFICGIKEIHLKISWQADEALINAAERAGFKIVRHFA